MEQALLLYNDIKSNVLTDVEDIFFAADVENYNDILLFKSQSHSSWRFLKK